MMITKRLGLLMIILFPKFLVEMVDFSEVEDAGDVEDTHKDQAVGGAEITVVL